ncbi:hypothetical protein D9M71_738990 [compost metagenome]
MPGLRVEIAMHTEHGTTSSTLGDEAVSEKMQLRLSNAPEMMRVRKWTVERPFGTLKQWMGATHFLTRELAWVSAKMSLNVLAYNMNRVLKIVGANGLMKALPA